MMPMSISVQGKYFVIAIIIVGSIGIWLPFVLAIPLGKTVPLESISINLTTYYVSLYFAGCVDYILRKLDTIEKGGTKSTVLNMIGLILLSIALIIVTVWLSVNNYVAVPIGLALVGTVIALRLWWVNNKENPTFSDRIRTESKQIHGTNWDQTTAES